MHMKIAPQLDRVAPQLPKKGAKLHLKTNLKFPGLVIGISLTVCHNKRYRMYIFESFEIFAGVFNKLSNGTTLLKIELQLLKI